MRVSDIRICNSSDRARLSAEVSFEALTDGPFEIWYDFPRALSNTSLQRAGDAFTAALLPIAMACAEPLRVDAAVSPTLCSSLPQIQDLYHSWEHTMSKIDILPDSLCDDAPAGTTSAGGLFFSLGVDSFYSLLRNLGPSEAPAVAQLILVRGFDIDLSAKRDCLYQNCLRAIEQVARCYAKAVVPVVTNIRELSERFVPWGRIYHGAALASVGLALGGEFHTIYIASSYDIDHLRPWGSHPALDPLWSNGSTTFIHDACDVTRLDKMRLIVKHAAAMDGLRICFENANGDYNCGRCDKCLHTMVYLHLVGGLSRCRTLPPSIDVAWLDQARPTNTTANSPFWKECHGALKQAEPESELTHAVGRYLARAREVNPANTIEMYADWLELKRRVAQAIARLPPPTSVVLLAGEDNVSTWLTASRHRIVSFPNENGLYWGTPADDAEAINQLERSRQGGALFLAIDRECFWWLDYYHGFREHLDRCYRQVMSDDVVVIFDLRGIHADTPLACTGGRESVSQ